MDTHRPSRVAQEEVVHTHPEEDVARLRARIQHLGTHQAAAADHHPSIHLGVEQNNHKRPEGLEGLEVAVRTGLRTYWGHHRRSTDSGTARFGHSMVLAVAAGIPVGVHADAGTAETAKGGNSHPPRH